MCAVKLIIIRETGMPASKTMRRMPNTLDHDAVRCAGLQFACLSNNPVQRSTVEI